MQAVAVDAHHLKIDEQSPIKFSHLTFAKDEHFEIAFRPENVKLVTENESSNEYLNLAVRIVNTEFLGAKRRLFCVIQNQNASDGNVSDEHVLQVDVDHQQMAIVQDDMYLQVPIRALHVFDARGRARC